MSSIRTFGRTALRYPVLLIGLWWYLYHDRSRTLGFFHDDWWSLVELSTGTAPWSFDRLGVFANLKSGYASRPALAAVCFVLSSVGEIDPARWQMLIALTMLSIALLFRMVLTRQGAAFHARDYLAGDIAGAIWLAAPWQMGVTCWPIMSGAIFSLLFFLAAFLCVRTDRSGWLRATCFGIALALSFLTYEAFYFVWAPFLLLYVWSTRESCTRPAIVTLLSAATISQVLCIGYNRYMQSLQAAVSKGIAENVWLGFVRNITSLPSVVAESVAEYSTAFEVCLSVLALLIVGALGMRLIRRAGPVALRDCIALGGFAVCALLLSFLLYASVGYSISAIGMQSRTMLPFTFVVAISSGALVSMTPTSTVVRTALIAAFGFLVGIFTLSSEYRLLDWQESWKQQTAILARAPLPQLKGLSSDDAVLFIGPSYANTVVIFGAFWDLTGAINSFPEFRAGRKATENVLRFYPATELYQWEFRDRTLAQSSGTVWTTRFPAARLFVWDYWKETLFQVPDGFTLSFDQRTKQYIYSAPELQKS